MFDTLNRVGCSWRRISCLMYIHRTYLKKNWGAFFWFAFSFFFEILYLLIFTIALKNQVNNANELQSFYQEIANYSFFYSSVVGMLVTCGFWVLKPFFDMRNTIMYKRIGLLRINPREFVTFLWIGAAMCFAATFILLMLVEMIIIGGVWSSIAGATASNYWPIIFNANWASNLFYLIVLCVFFTSSIVIINALCTNPNIGNWYPGLVFIIWILIFQILSFLPSISPSAFGWRNSNWFANSYQFYTLGIGKRTVGDPTKGIGQWPAYAQVLFFVGCAVIAGAVGGVSSKYAMKNFKWSP